MIIAFAKLSYEDFLGELHAFMPYLSSWALVDCTVSRMRIIEKHRAEFMAEVKSFLKSENPWYIRFGIIALLSHYVTEEYIDECISLVSSVTNDHYYVRIGTAWLIAECFTKFPDKTLPLLTSKTLDPWTHNKAIQKIRESYRVTPENKEFVNTLKIKN
jgi:3-methyladenine DNA glycosylase AlkD